MGRSFVECGDPLGGFGDFRKDVFFFWGGDSPKEQNKEEKVALGSPPPNKGDPKKTHPSRVR